jgi:hypothetical protein
MSFTNFLLEQSLVYGFILSLILGVLIYGSLFINPEIWLHDFPPDIRAKYGPAGEKALRQRKILSALFFPAILGVLIVSLVHLSRVSGGELAFMPVFLNLLTILMVFNLFDLVILDWLIALVIRPRFMILPGTEGMAGYRDFTFHLRGFLKGTLLLTITSLVIATGVIAVGSIL